MALADSAELWACRDEAWLTGRVRVFVLHVADLEEGRVGISYCVCLQAEATVPASARWTLTVRVVCLSNNKRYGRGLSSCFPIHATKLTETLIF